MNTEMRTKSDFERNFFKLMNNLAFRKTMESVKKDRDNRLVVTGRRMSILVSILNYDTTKWFSKKLLEIKMIKTEVKTNKPAYLDLSILDKSKIAMYKYWYSYPKLKYESNAKLCCIATDSFIVHVKSEDVYTDLT